MNTFEFDSSLFDRFLAGTLDPQDEAMLAEQVARLVPHHWTLPHPVEAAYARIVGHLGGQRALLAWLDRHPGRPRLVARLNVLQGLLEHLSATPAVVAALRDLRTRDPYPRGLAGYLAPSTDDGTIASLAGEIESLLGNDRPDEAVRLALAVVDTLQQIAPAAAERDPDLRDLADLLEQARQDILAASPRPAGTSRQRR